MEKFYINTIILALLAFSLQAQVPSIEWEKTFDGQTSGFDQAKYVRANNNNHLFVTGTANGSGTLADVVTRKYDAAGNLLWSHVYNNSNYNMSDEPFDMELTTTGDVVIVGRTRTSAGMQPNSIGFIYMLNGSTGAQLWLDSIKGPGFSGSNFSYLRKLVVSSTNEIYATGNYTSSNAYMMVSVKYSILGTQQWLQSYDNSTSSSFHQNAGADITLDNSGDILVAGFSNLLNTGENFAIWKLNPTNGNQVWFSAKPGPVNNVYTNGLRSIIADAASNIYVYGIHSGNKHRIVKYNSLGAEQWTYDFDTIAVGFTSSFTGADMHLTFDNSGNVIFGSCFGTSPGTKIGIAKFSTSGNVLWFKLFVGTSGNNNELYGLVTDDKDNILFAGATSNPGFDVATYRLDANGDIVWQIVKDGTASGNDKGHSIALGAGGAIFVGGLITNATNGDYYVVKYQDSTLSVSNQYNSTLELPIQIFPNPVSHQLNIQNLQTGSAIRLLNNFGQVVKSSVAFHRVFTINMDAYSAGQYIIQIVSPSGSILNKMIIVQKQ